MFADELPRAKSVGAEEGARHTTPMYPSRRGYRLFRRIFKPCSGLTRSIFVMTPIVRRPFGSTLRDALRAVELARSTSAADIARMTLVSRMYFSHNSEIFSLRVSG